MLSVSELKMVDTIRLLVGQTIKVRPHGKRRAYTVAKLIEVSDSGKTATIIPKGHRREEQIMLEEIQIWKKGLALNQRETPMLSKPLPSVIAICVKGDGGIRYYYWTKNTRDRWSNDRRQALEFETIRAVNVALGLINGERSVRNRPPEWRELKAQIIHSGHAPSKPEPQEISSQVTPEVAKPLPEVVVETPIVQPVAPVVNEEVKSLTPVVVDKKIATQSLIERYEIAKRDELAARLMLLDAQKVVTEIECEIAIEEVRRRLK
jgi:hypothetical protein